MDATADDREARAAAGLQWARRGVRRAVGLNKCPRHLIDEAESLAGWYVAKGLAGAYRGDGCPWEKWSYYKGYYSGLTVRRVNRELPDSLRDDEAQSRPDSSPWMTRDAFRDRLPWDMAELDVELLWLYANGYTQAEAAERSGVAVAWARARYPLLFAWLSGGPAPPAPSGVFSAGRGPAHLRADRMAGRAAAVEGAIRRAIRAGHPATKGRIARALGMNDGSFGRMVRRDFPEAWGDMVDRIRAQEDLSC